VVQILRLIHSRSIAIFEIVGTRVDPPTPQFLRPSSIRRNLRLTAEFLDNLFLSLWSQKPQSYFKISLVLVELNEAPVSRRSFSPTLS